MQTHPIMRHNEAPPGCRLVLGRVSEHTSAQQLREHFGAYGTVTDVFVSETKRGFGYVTFSNETEADLALAVEHLACCGYHDDIL